jgi:L-serine dehydratase
MPSEPYDRIQEAIRSQGLAAGALTFGDCIRLAASEGVPVGAAVIAEAMTARGLNAHQVAAALMEAFAHNLAALEVGRTRGRSALMGAVGRDLTSATAPKLTGNALLDKALAYTLASQVGNHAMGLQPCAGTGDACAYTGLFQAMREEIDDPDAIARGAAVMLKLGTLFREAKSTTGCNLEGFGAGAAAAAAAFTEIAGGGSGAMERAVVLALSPTIAVPCTPRVMVPGLCATHIGGGVLIGWLASHLAVHTALPVTVPVDVMMALAVAVHPISAQTVVPEVVRHMAPFFQSREEVETLVADAERYREVAANQALLEEARTRMRAHARQARSIVDPFAPAVVGGSSQAVGSPANTARLAHHLARGRIRRVEIALAAELFARRGINVPAILAAAAYGSATDDPEAYAEVFPRLARDGVAVELGRSEEAGRQQITIRADQGDAMVAALNRGGGRLHLLEAQPSLAAARELAAALGIEIVA